MGQRPPDEGAEAGNGPLQDHAVSAGPVVHRPGQEGMTPVPMPLATAAAPRSTPALLGGAPRFQEPVYVTRPRAPDEAVFGNLLATIFRARWFTNDGAVVREFEERLRLRLGVGFCAAFCNGTVALQVALRSLGLSGEVITTPFTFPATVHAIEWNGLTPVFCDVDPATYNLDPTAAADLVTERT